MSYLLDGLPLRGEEGSRHRGAFNAALNALIQGESECPVVYAYKMADAAVREFRRRSVPDVQPEGQEWSLYRRLGNLEAEREWIERKGKRKPAQALVLMKWHEREEPDAPMSAAEIRAMAGVNGATIKALVATGMLVREDR